MLGFLISIIMPAYRASETIDAAILSVILQTYPHWELLVIDDGSPDSLAPKVDAFKDPRIRFIRLEKNQGLPNALNVGLREARAQYVARMDCDDVMEDHRLKEQLLFMMREGLAICGTGAEKFGVEEGRIVSPGKGREIINAFLGSNPFVHPTVMFDRQRLPAKLAYDATFRCEEDYELWSRILTEFNCGNLPGSGLFYRTASGSNANHPYKKRFKQKALEQFARRMGIIEFTPIDIISEFQVSGFVDEPGFHAMRQYALYSHRSNLPTLGWLQEPLLDCRNFRTFFSWLNSVRQFTPYRY
ncbi:glycosyltransferase family 2 protein [Rhabdaerophilum sp.]|uniref:glycosyltransferase family 2 protein n=1 Tax=Rhabdaerophilum sp. TaxID=2717341 RepID=UPI0038D4ED8D